MFQKAEIPEPVGSPSLEIMRSQWNKALDSLIFLYLHRRVEYRNFGGSFEPLTYSSSSVYTGYLLINFFLLPMFRTSSPTQQ